MISADEIPAKEETIVWVELTAQQKRQYRALLDRNGALLASLTGSGAAGSGKANLPSMSNICMKLRQLCNHPRLLEKADVPLPVGVAAEAKALAQLVEASGKMVLLHKLLLRLRAEGRKVLLFSQFTRMLDLLEDYLHLSRPRQP